MATGEAHTPITFILVRHGRTALNTEGRFRGLSPVPLDEVGVQQAQRLAERMRELCSPGGPLPPPVAVGSSPRPRALQTAEPIARALDVPVRTVEDLADMDYGEWQGLTLEAAEARDPKLFSRWRAFPEDTVVPGGESLGNMQRRVVKVLGECLQESEPGKSWILVAHDAVWRAVFCWALRLSLTKRDQFWQDPACINILEIPQDLHGTVILRVMNDTSHLLGLPG